MKIVILEENHFEVLDSYLKILNFTYGNNSIFVVTNSRILSLLETDVNKDNLLLTDNFIRNAKLCSLIMNFMRKNKFDILLYNTIEMGDYPFANNLVKRVRREFSTKIVLSIHNVNTLLMPSFYHSWRPITIFKVIKDNFKKLSILKRVDAFNVLCENQKAYIIENFEINKPVFYIPSCISENKNTTSFPVLRHIETGKLNLMILGSVDINRKDYKTVIQALNILGCDCMYIRLFIIGSADSPISKYIYESLHALEKDYSLSFSFPKDEVASFSNNDVSILSSSADFFLCPTLPYSIYEGNKEFYGISKSTGNFYDIIRYKKPAIFPEYIPVPPYLKDCILTYNNPNTLSALLKKIISDLELRKKIAKSVEIASSNFTINEISHSVKVQFSSILN